MAFDGDDMLAELARLERSAFVADIDEESSEEKVQQWQWLFQYSAIEAAERIKKRSGNFDRFTIPNELWDEVKAKKEAEGFDKDAYEHFLDTQSRSRKNPENNQLQRGNRQQTPQVMSDKFATYLVKLEGALSTPQQLQLLAGLNEPPKIEYDDSDPRIQFCRVSASERWRLQAALPYKQTFIRLTLPAPKCLNNHSRHPTLGIDPTLPQHRLDAETVARPLKDEYPVWYFFYGTLADPQTLSDRLGCVDDGSGSALHPRLELRKAHVAGGRLTTWGGTYRALIDGSYEAHVEGSAYLVRNKEDEEKLRYYETDWYEVVRCTIEMDIEAGKREVVEGCTFRFRE